jgi:hypothetical protein
MVALTAIRQAGLDSQPGPLTVAGPADLPSTGQFATTGANSPPATPSSIGEITTTPPSTDPPIIAVPTTTVPPTAATTSPTTTAAGDGTVYTLVGGSAAVQVSGDQVALLWATPHTGFTVTVEAAGPEEVKVKFKSETHTSELRAKWTEHGLDVTERERDV